MDDSQRALILASGSPRRLELLGRVVASFKAAASPVEENGAALEPNFAPVPLPLPDEYRIADSDHPTLWAWHKAADVAGSLPAGGSHPVVLGADTIVIGPGRIFGKPANASSAEEMLRGLRGKKHFVATGYALVSPGGEKRLRTLTHGAVLSAVGMRGFSDAELEGYVATGEPLDKAGAYAVQGLGGQLVERVEGCYFNVVGLPLCTVRLALDRCGVPVLPAPEDGYCSACRRLLNERGEHFVPE